MKHEAQSHRDQRQEDMNLEDDGPPAWVNWNRSFRRWMATMRALDRAGGLAAMTASWPRAQRVRYLENLLRIRDAWDLRINEFVEGMTHEEADALARRTPDGPRTG